MADKTIIVKIEAIVSNVSSKIKQLTGDLDKLARGNNIVGKSLGLLSTKQKDTLKTLKGLDDGTKAVAKSFLQLDTPLKTLATKYAKIDDSTRKLGESYYKLSSAIRNGSKAAVGGQIPLLRQFEALPSHVKATLTQFSKQNAVTQQSIKGFAGLGQSIRGAITHFSSFSPKLQQSNAGVLSFTKSIGGMAKGLVNVDKLKSAFGSIGKALFSFQNAGRTAVSASRAIGTSMIFAGGAFRGLGVAINVVSSTLGSFLPAIGAVSGGLAEGAAALGPYALLLAPIVVAIVTFVANLVVAVAQIGIATVALYQVAEAGIEFNRVMETTQISIATLTTQFKNLYDSQGQQIGAMETYTDKQLLAMSVDERRAVSQQQSIAINDKLTASMGDAEMAFNALTVEAAQSPYTTQELASGFQAVVSSMGQYNITTEQAAKLTVSLGRVASVAGVSAGNLASQFTLFLTGAGRITSPLSRFAAQIGLSKQKMMELREEFKKAKDDPVRSAALMDVLTGRLKAFDEAGRRVASSWTGIMSNMTEAFELFAGSVTKGLFTSIRDGLFRTENVVQNGQEVVDVYNKVGEKIDTIFGSSAEKMLEEFDKNTKKIPGSFAKVRTEAKGILSEIFNYDANGALPTKINRVADVFTDKFQPIILLVEDLFNIIGTDIAGALSNITDLVSGVGTSYEENYATIIQIYEFLKAIGIIIWDFIVGLGEVFGITGNIKDTASTIETVVAIIAIGLGTIRVVLHFIMAVLYLITTVIKGIITAIVAVGETIWKVLKALYYAVTGDFSAALGVFTEGWAATSYMADATANSFGALTNQLAGMGNAFTKVGEQGARTGQILANTKKRTEDATRVTKELTENYRKLAREQQLFKDSSGKVVDALGPGQKFKKNEKTGKLEVVDSKGRTVREDVTQIQESDLKNLTSSEVRRLDRSLKARTKNPISDTSPVKLPEDDEDKKAAEKRKQIQKEILDTLFDENKKFAEKQIDLEKSRIDDQLELVKSYYEFQKDLFDTQLAENELSLQDYYDRQAGLIQNNLEVTLASIQTELNALDKQRELNLLEFEQDRKNAKAKFLQSKQNAGDLAQYEVEIAKIKRKSETAELDYLKEKEKLETKAELDRRKAASDELKSLLAFRDALRKAFDDVRQLRQQLDNDLGNILDSDSVKRMQEAISRQYIEQYDFFKAQQQDAVTDGNTKLMELGREGERLLVQRILLERTRLDIANEQKKLEIEEFDRSRELLILEEQRKYGYINTTDYLKQVTSLNEKNVIFLKKQLDILLAQSAVAIETKDLNTQLDLRQKILDTQIKLNEAQNVSETVLLRITGDIRDSFKDFLGTVLDDVSSIGDAFDNLGKTIRKTFQKALVDKLFRTPAFEKLFGNVGQEGGQATGKIAEFFRYLGVDPASAEAAKNAQIDFTASTESAASAVQKLTAEIEAQLKAQSEERKNQTADVNARIKEKQDELNVNWAYVTTGKFDTVIMPKVVEPSVINSETGAVIKSKRDLGDRIGGGEGGYNSYNRGNAGDSSGKSIDFSKLTIGQIMAMQGRKEVFAVGKYQLIPETLLAAKNSLGLDLSTLFTPAIQEKIFADYLLKTKRPAVENYFKGTGSINDALLALSQEFASVGVPYDVVNNKGKLIKKGRSYYSGVGNNSASISPESLIPLLQGIRASYQTPTNAVTKVEVTKVSSDAERTLTLTQTQDLEKLAEEQEKSNVQTTTKISDVDTSLQELPTKFNQGFTSELESFRTGLVTYFDTKFGEVVTAISSVFSTTAPNVTKKAWGGYISGPGGPTEDKVPAWLSNGEFVVKAAAVKALGIDKLHEINNADKALPQFGFGAYIGNIFKTAGKYIKTFLKSDIGKLVLTNALPLIMGQLLGEKAANAMAFVMPFIFAGAGKGGSKKNPLEGNQDFLDKYWKNSSKASTSKKAQKFMMKNLGATDIRGYNPPTGGATGGLAGLSGIQKFAKGGVVHSLFGGSLPRFDGGGGASAGSGGGGGFWNGPIGGAIIGGAIQIGMTLLSRLFRKKQPKSDPNRKADPYGMNPDTLTFYKKPIITGSRNYLAKGGLISPSMLLNSMPSFAAGGLNTADLEDIVNNVQSSENAMNITQNINITTPDVHSFRNSRGQLERDLARVTQRGLKRRAPKY